MALIPQINNQLNTTTSIVEIPSRTYKIDIENDEGLLYSEDYTNIIKFKFDNHNLIEIPQYPNPEVTFSIVDGNLKATSDNENLLNKYHIEGYNLMMDTEYYSDRIMGYVDNLEAIRQAVYHILMVERYSYLIYSDNYGVELNQYIGKGFDYLTATIEETLKDALMYDLRITDVVVTEINEISKDVANIKFIVYSIYGNLQMEVNISV